jgi:hypothetical protein
MSHGTRRLLLAESILLLAPPTVLVALGFAWSARFLVASVRDGNWQDPTTWMSAAIAAGLVGTLAGWWLLIRAQVPAMHATRHRCHGHCWVHAGKVL